MLRTLATSLVIPLTLGASIVLAAAAEQPADTSHSQPATSGSSGPVPPGKVMLPPLPLAKMPDTSMPKEPDVAPLPGTGNRAQPARAKPGGS